MTISKHSRRFLGLLILFAVLIAGCNPSTDLPKDQDLPNEYQPIVVHSIEELYTQITKGIAVSNPWVTRNLFLYGRDSLGQGVPVLYDNTTRYDTLRETLDTITNLDNSGLTDSQRINLEIAKFFIEQQLLDEDYVLNNILVTHLSPFQLLQSHFFLLDFPTETREDIDLFLSILADAQSLLYQPVNALQRRIDEGYLPPAFAINQIMAGELNPPDISAKLASVKSAITAMSELTPEEKSKQITVVDDAASIFRQSFAEVKSLLASMQEKATINGGLWTMPRGKEYYQVLLRQNTTSDLTPDQVHNLGLQEVERIQAEIRSALDELGFYGVETSLALKQIDAKNYLSPAAVEAECRKIIEDITAQLPLWFDLLPQGEIELNVSTDIPFRAMAGAGYVAINPEYFNTRHSLQAVIFHEAIPGHHFQLSLQQEHAELPPFREGMRFNAFTEGWALYVERLALENGSYYNKESELGYLLSDLLRAARLVVDTGLHYKDWTKEEAMNYMTNTIGETAEDEIERYIVMPGQASAYKIGELKILELRDMAKAQLQDKFEIKEFHNVILANGAIPLTVLEKEVERYIESKR